MEKPVNKVFETERLYAREMTQNDLKALSSILQDAETMRAYEHVFSDDEVQAWLDKQLENYRRDGHGLWAIVLKETDEMIGQCGLTWQDVNGSDKLEVGYLFNKNYWHKGYASEAAIETKNYAFNVVKVSEVCTIARDTNFASMNVAIRNGMTVKERIIKNYYGVTMPHYVFFAQNKKPSRD